MAKQIILYLACDQIDPFSITRYMAPMLSLQLKMDKFGRKLNKSPHAQLVTKNKKNWSQARQGVTRPIHFRLHLMQALNLIVIMHPFLTKKIVKIQHVCQLFLKKKKGKKCEILYGWHSHPLTSLSSSTRDD